MKNPQEKDFVMLKLVDSVSIIIEKIGVVVQVSEQLKVHLQRRILPLVSALLLKYSARVTQKACRLILIMFRRFRSFLKLELYILLDNIILSALQKEILSPDIKLAFIQLLAGLLSDRDTLTDIFSNYDCFPGYNNTLDKSFEVLGRFC